MDLLRMVVKKRSQDTTRVKDSETLTKFASRVAKLKGEGPLASTIEPEVTLEVVSININDIEVPENYPRKSSGDVSSLVSSIKLYGIQQPIKVVKIKGANKYRLVFGLRRIKAAKTAGLDVVPCIVELVTIESRLMMLSMVENLSRLNLNPIEEACSYQTIGNERINDELCNTIGCSIGHIQEALSLLALPANVQEEAMAESALYSWGILLVLLNAYQSSSANGKKLFQAIATGKVNSVAQAENFVQNL